MHPPLEKLRTRLSPNETLYVDIPKIAETTVIVPRSGYFTFDLNVSGHANNTLVRGGPSDLRREGVGSYQKKKCKAN